MKKNLLIILFCAVFLNASLFGFYRDSDEENIPMQKSKTREDKKKPEKEDKEDKEDNDAKDSSADSSKDSKETKDKSLKDRIKDKLKKDKERKEGGRFGDKRF